MPGPTARGGNRRGHHNLPLRRTHVAAFDAVSAVRATSSGFSVLLLGFLLAPVLSALVTGSALFAEFLACAAAGAVAGKRVGDARLVHFQGALAASSAFLLFLPLLLWLPLGRDAERNLYFGITTAAAGACAGFLAGRRRDDEPHAR